MQPMRCTASRQNETWIQAKIRPTNNRKYILIVGRQRNSLSWLWMCCSLAWKFQLSWHGRRVIFVFAELVFWGEKAGWATRAALTRNWERGDLEKKGGACQAWFVRLVHGARSTPGLPIFDPSRMELAFINFPIGEDNCDKVAWCKSSCPFDALHPRQDETFPDRLRYLADLQQNQLAFRGPTTGTLELVLPPGRIWRFVFAQQPQFAMSSYPLKIPHPRTVLHLYRHLLREASYLPKPIRPFVANTIRDRFSKHRDVTLLTPKRIKSAHHQLRKLRAANAGDLERMRKLVYTAFGRLGSRRIELLRRYFTVDSEVKDNSDALAEYIRKQAEKTAADKRREPDWLDNWDTDKLKALIRSQAPREITDSPLSKLTFAQTTPEKAVPTTNIWGGPTTDRLARNKLLKVWKKIFPKLLPPVPKEEWEMIRDIAENKPGAPSMVPPPRRPVAKPLMEGALLDEKDWKWQDYVTQPVRKVDRQANRKNKLLSGIEDKHSPVGDPRSLAGHNYTERRWRRMMEHLWRLTPIMEKVVVEKNGKTQEQWKVTWGNQLATVARAHDAELEFFAGIPQSQLEQTRKRATRGKKREGSQEKPPALGDVTMQPSDNAPTAPYP